MPEFITLENSLAVAIESAMIAAERNDFKKTIRMLEYVSEYKRDYDRVMVNYFLLYSYFATGDLFNASRVLEDLKKLDIHNEQILQVVNEIEKEINNSTTVEYSQELEEDLTTIKQRINQNGGYEKISKNYRDSPFLFLIENSEMRFKELEELYYEAKELLEIVNDLQKIDNSEVNLIFMNVINRISLNGFFWELITLSEYKAVINNDNIRRELKNIFIGFAIHFSKYLKITKYDIKEINKINIKDQKYDISEVFHFTVIFENIYSSDDLNHFEFINILFLVLGYYEEFNTKNVTLAYIVATVLYSINDAFNLTNYDEDVLELSLVKKNELESEIANISQLIPFLKLN